MLEQGIQVYVASGSLLLATAWSLCTKETKNSIDNIKQTYIKHELFKQHVRDLVISML